MHAAKKRLLLPAIALATFAIALASGGEPTGDVAAMRKIEALQREAQALYPRGTLAATVRSENLSSRGSMEAKIVAYWDGDRTRTEAKILDERTFPKPRKSERTHFEVTRGGEILQFGEQKKIAFLGGQRDAGPRGTNYLACMPIHCWFGGDEATGRPWSWFLERCDEQTPVDRTTDTQVDGSLVRIRQTCRKNGQDVADITATFDLDLAGMCVSYGAVSNGMPKSATYDWTLDDRGRPLLRSMSWKRSLLDGQVNSAEITIESFDPEFVPEEAKFSFDLAQFPPGMQIADQRGREPRTIRVEPGATLDRAPGP